MPSRPSDYGPPEPEWEECSRCCDWARAGGPTTREGEPLCDGCAEETAAREAEVCAEADELGIGGGP